MHYGHIRIIGITLKPEALKTWTQSIHAINYVLNDMNIFSYERFYLKSIIRILKSLKEESRLTML